MNTNKEGCHNDVSNLLLLMREMCSRQRNKIKTPEEQLSEMDVGSLPEKEFRGKIVKMSQE